MATAIMIVAITAVGTTTGELPSSIATATRGAPLRAVTTRRSSSRAATTTSHCDQDCIARELAPIRGPFLLVLAGQPEAFTFWLEAGPEDRRIKRVFEAITHEHRIFVFD